MSDLPKNSESSSNADSAVNKRIWANAKIIAFFTLLSRVLGAAREFILLHIFGAGAVLDAFIIAFTIPNVFRRLTAEGALTMVFVPLYIEIKETRSKAAARLFAQKVISLVTIGTSLLVGLGMLFSTQIVYLFASGFADNAEKLSLTIELTQITFPYLIFISLTALSMGILNAEQKFASPAAAPILLNIAMIGAAIFLSPFFNTPIHAVGWGVIAGGVAQLVLQVPFLLQVDQSLKPKSFLNDPDIQRMLRLMAPTLFGVAVYQINIIILRSIGSTLPDGHLTYYNLASRLQELVIGVLAFSFAMASLPEFSKQTSNQEWDKAYSTLSTTLASALFFLLPATAGFIAFALPIVAMLSLHGEFKWDDVLITASALQFISLGIPALAIIRILVSIFFALKDTRSPVIASTISMLATGVSGWYLSQSYQVIGLVSALSLGMWVQVLMLALLLNRKSLANKKWFPLADIGRYIGLSLLIAGLVYLALPMAEWQMGPFSWHNWAVFIAVIVSATASYIAILALLKDKQALAILGRA